MVVWLMLLFKTTTTEQQTTAVFNVCVISCLSLNEIRNDRKYNIT